MNPEIRTLLLNAAEVSKVGKEKMEDFLATKVDNAEGTHTAHTGAGAEASVKTLYKSELYSMIVEDDDLLSKLPGNHGQIEGESAKVTIKGLPRLMANGEEQKSYANPGETRNNINTAQVTIAPKKFTDSFYLSYEMINSFVDAQGLYNYIMDLIKKNMRRTINAYVINADGETNITTGNINHKTAGTEVALDTTAYFLHTGAEGIVKTAIKNGLVSDKSNPAALSRMLLKKLRKGVGSYAAEVQDLLLIASGSSYIDLTYLDSYSTVDKFGNNATNKTGLLERVDGIELMANSNLMTSVDKEGYHLVGTDAAEGNKYTGMSLLYKPAVQFGFGHDPVIVDAKDEHGIRIGYSLWFDSVIVNGEAGLDKTVSGAVIPQE